MDFIKKAAYSHLLLFLLTASILALIGAYISQYAFDLQPCILCFYQRKPFFAVAVLTGLALFIPQLKKRQQLIIMISMLLLMVNAFLALYHAGVEKKIFTGPAYCTDITIAVTDIEELRQALAASQIVRCDQPSFIFLNISMAGWNVIYCLLLVLISLFGLKLIRANQ